MKTRIIQIGNSHGIRIPKPLLGQIGLKGEVEIRAKGNALEIRSVQDPRAAWVKAFREMVRRGDDTLLDDVPHSLSSWDEDEWEWR